MTTRERLHQLVDRLPDQQLDDAEAVLHALETADIAIAGADDKRLSPQRLGTLAQQLASTSDADEAARLREQLTRGFYGI